MPMAPNLKSHLQYESAARHSQHMSEIQASRGVVNATLRASAVKQYDEPGVAESRAVDKILRLPS